jgi:hypothetical protein
MDVEAELSQLAEEFGFGVKHIGTSRWTKSHGAPGERAYVAVTTLEGTPLCIELSTRGWKVRKKRGRWGGEMGPSLSVARAAGAGRA